MSASSSTNPSLVEVVQTIRIKTFVVCFVETNSNIWHCELFRVHGVRSCCTQRSASKLIWLQKNLVLPAMFQLLLSRPGGPGARDMASGQILPNPFQGGHCWWRSGHLSGGVTMIVSAKEPSVRPSLKKQYVFNYSALSEIWIGSAWLRWSNLGSVLLCAG